MRRLLRGLSYFLIALGVAVFVIGPVYELIERRRAERNFPAPGRLVKIGDRKMQIDCRGDSAPTVVFESGLGPSGATDWVKVHDEVAKFTRACAYSRAGIMWSDDKPGVHDGAGVAQDLHAALEASGEKGPLVLVGHSVGGSYITIFTKLYGDRVAGLVYIDSSHPEQEKRFQAALGHPFKPPFIVDEGLKLAARLSWTGLVRLGLSVMGPPPIEGADESTTKIVMSFGPSSLSAMQAETDALSQTFAEAPLARSERVRLRC